jgi:hypothetical protein
MLVELRKYHRVIAKTIQSTAFLEKLLASLIDQECDFVRPIACHFLLILSENDENLFDGLQKTPLFEQLLLKLRKSAPTECESLVVLLRMLLTGGEPKRNDLEQLAAVEDFIFTLFLRNIEFGNAFQAVALFQIITFCSKYIEGWLIRMKRIVVDSQFPALVVGPLIQSQNRHAISDGMLALHYLLTCKEPSVFELFVPSFFLIGQETRSKQIDSGTVMATKLRETETRLNEATAKLHEQELELDALKNAHANLTEKYEAQTAGATIRCRYTETISKLKSIIMEIKSENFNLKTKVQSQEAVIQEFKQDNSVLTERLSSLSKLSEEREEHAKVMKTRIQEGGQTDFALRAAEEKLEQTGKQLVGSAQQIARLETELHRQIENTKAFETEVERLKEEANRESETANKLRQDLEAVEAQNEIFRRVQKDINHIKRKYAGKKKMLAERAVEAEKEKRKWETIARFQSKVRETKFETAQEVYSVNYQ